jgi:hypothetical protein
MMIALAAVYVPITLDFLFWIPMVLGCLVASVILVLVMEVIYDSLWRFLEWLKASRL